MQKKFSLLAARLCAFTMQRQKAEKAEKVNSVS